MLFFQSNYSTLVENVAADEVLLDWCDAENCGPVMRLWESPEEGIVLGYGNAIRAEVAASIIDTKSLPIVRRCSGGGTILQGTGCFNYSFILPISMDADLNSIVGTTHWVMDRLQIIFQALATDGALQPDNPLAIDASTIISVRGDSDLTINGIKFSGNAQRRRKKTILFHGTILSALRLERVSQTLNHPSKEPAYRQGRPHHQFITNVGVSWADFYASMMGFFKPVGTVAGPVSSLVDDAVLRYTSAEWNLKF